MPSQPTAAHGNISVGLRIDFRDPEGVLVSRYCNDHDLTLFQLSQFIQASYLAVNAASIKATDATTQAVTGAITANTPQIEFGTGASAAAYADFAIQTAVTSSSAGADVAAG